MKKFTSNDVIGRVIFTGSEDIRADSYGYKEFSCTIMEYNEETSEFEETTEKRNLTVSEMENALHYETGENYKFDYIKENRSMKVYTADKETGTFIDEFESIEEAKAAIEKYERADKADGTYEEDFYDVVDENHCSLI